MFFGRDGNDVVIRLPLTPEPEDQLSAHQLIEELQEIPQFLKSLPALQTFQTELERVSGEALPPALLT